MSPSRPYLIRALYEWIMDNHATPHLLVNSELDGVIVPREHVKDGRIVLNVDADAVQGLEIGNESVCFNARFSGSARRIEFPVSAVLAIYARENGRGMMFSEEDGEDPQPPPGKDSSSAGSKKRRGLRVVK